MASTDDTQRAAIRERKRQAHVALRERHQRQEAAQTAAFSALDRLARQLDQAVDELAADDGDPLERAAAVTTIAAQLAVVVDDVRRTANELVAVASMTQQEVAELLGTRSALLFPRARSASRPARPASSPAAARFSGGGRGLSDRSLPHPELFWSHVDRASDLDGWPAVVGRRTRERPRRSGVQRRPRACATRRVGSHSRVTLPSIDCSMSATRRA